MTRTATVSAFGGSSVSIAQHMTKKVGRNPAETVTISAGDVTMQIHSSVAKKFASAALRVHHVHLDINFLKIDTNTCSGPLPEIWGSQEMTADTAKLLVEPTV